MNLTLVRNELLILGTPGGGNPHGNCTVCAVMAANALVYGVSPVGAAPPAAWSVDAEAARAGAAKVYDIAPDHMRRRHEHSRAYLVWKWLKGLSSGVFVFEQSSDHVFNFVVSGDIYLIDTALRFARRVNTPGDCSVVSIPYDQGYGYNYISPICDDEDEADSDDLSVYYWGELHRYWR